MAGRAHAHGYRSAGTVFSGVSRRPSGVGRGHQRGAGRRHRAPLRLRAQRHELAGDRQGRRHRRRQRGGCQPPAPRDRRGAGRGGQARPVREAARSHLDRRPGDVDAVEAAGVVARVGFTFRRTPGDRAASRSSRVRWAARCTSTRSTGPTTAATRKRR